MHLSLDQAAQLLGVPRDATAQEIRSAYKRLALRFHPDKNNQPDATQQFQRISMAYKKLCTRHIPTTNEQFMATSTGDYVYQWRSRFRRDHDDAEGVSEEEEEEIEIDVDVDDDDDDDTDSSEDMMDLEEMLELLRFVLSTDGVMDGMGGLSSHLAAAWMAHELFDLMGQRDSEQDDEDDGIGDDDMSEFDPSSGEEEDDDDNDGILWMSTACENALRREEEDPEWIDEEVYSTDEEEADEQEEEDNQPHDEAKRDEQETTKGAAIQLNSRVCLFGKLYGTVRFIGPVHYISGEFVGIDLDEPVGKNNGNIKGVEYFKCEPGHGLMVRRHDDLRVIA